MYDARLVWMYGDNCDWLFCKMFWIVGNTEAELLDVIGTNVLRVFLLAILSHLYYGFYSHLLQKWFETGL